MVIPAFNEESGLPRTLQALRASIERCAAPVQVVVVDNDSQDNTARLTRQAGAEVVTEKVHNVARVRNTGARAAGGDVLVFLDADILVPPRFLARVVEVMSAPECCGGAADVVHQPSSKLVRAYLLGWRAIGLALGMAQGAAQFCRRDAFERLGGYDESLYMGEDVDFYWRLRRLGPVAYLRGVQVVASPRRFDHWPLWRTLLWTNPLFILAFQRSPNAWRGWYRDPPR